MKLWKVLLPLLVLGCSLWCSCPVLEPSVRDSAVSRLVNGTQMITPQVLSAAIGFRALISSAASLRFLFIFQLPAIIAFLSALFMTNSSFLMILMLLHL